MGIFQDMLQNMYTGAGAQTPQQQQNTFSGVMGGALQGVAPFMGQTTRPNTMAQVLAGAAGGMTQGMNQSRQNNLQMQDAERQRVMAEMKIKKAKEQELIMDRLRKYQRMGGKDADGNDVLMPMTDSMLEAQFAESIKPTPKDKGFALSPGQKQFDSKGNVIATGASLPQMTVLTPEEVENLGFTKGTVVGKDDEGQLQVIQPGQTQSSLEKESDSQSALQSSINSGTQRLGTLQTAIAKSKKLADSWATSGKTQLALGWVPGSDAYSLESSLNTVKSIVGFDELLRIKAAGGTLGALSDSETKLLQAVQGALDANLEGEELIKTLDNIEKLYKENLAEKQRSYDKQYGSSNNDPLGLR